MASVTESTQGSKLSFGVQDDFNDPQTTLKDMRPEGEPTVEAGVGEGVEIDTTGANPFFNEKPIVNNQASDSAVQVTSLIRQANTAGNDSFLKTAFESGGYSVVSGTDTNVSTGAIAGNLPVDSATSLDVGMGVNIEMPDGNYVPALLGFVSGSNILPTMETPSIADDGAEVRKAFTVTPDLMTGIANDKLLTIVHGTNVGTTTAQDCALTSVGDLTFTPNEKLMLEYTFGASDKTKGDVSTTHSNDFADGTGALTTYQPWCQFANTNTDYASALSASYHKLLSATVTLGITAEQIMGFGDANCKNNLQGWMQKGEPATIVLDMLYDTEKLSDFDGSNVDKYIGIIQPGTSEDKPAVGFFALKCHQSVAPSVEYYGNNECRVQVTYTVNPSEMDGTTDEDQGNQPWYLVVGDKSA